MRSKQRGLTLIEMIIVIGIISVLAGASIMTYSDYMQRAKVYETLLLLSALKTPILEFARVQNDHGNWPATPASIGSITEGKYTTNITIAKPKIWGQVISLMSEGSIILVYDTITHIWTCTHSPGYTLKYLPHSCK